MTPAEPTALDAAAREWVAREAGTWIGAHPTDDLLAVDAFRAGAAWMAEQAAGVARRIGAHVDPLSLGTPPPPAFIAGCIAAEIAALAPPD